MIEPRLSPEMEKTLRSQVIDLDHPGTLLRDFQMLLDFIGPAGVESSGKYHLLPLGSIKELDARLSRPLRLTLERPQLRSHPYLQGLHQVLRASGLVQTTRKGARTWLTSNAALRESWDRLNPTEQYFNLFEAWGLRARGEMVGERENRYDNPLSTILIAWQFHRMARGSGDTGSPSLRYLSGGSRSLYQLAVLDLFGLVAVKHPAKAAAAWAPAEINATPFGDALFTLLTQQFESPYQLLRGLEDLDGLEDEGEDGAATESRLGRLQPLLQPYFPDWKENLTASSAEYREGTHVFRVSLGKVWRQIALPPGNTLHDLLLAVLDSMGFDYDHLYAFTYADPYGRRVTVGSPEVENDEIVGTEVEVGSLPLQVGDTMDLVYDFGDNWQFSVKLESVEPGKSRLKTSKVLEKHGKPPKQYGDWD